MLLGSITVSAWIVKPLIGYCIDNFLNKKLWIFIALVLNAALALFVGFRELPLAILVAILVITSAGSAFRDVAADGIMCVEGKKYNATGRIQSIQWISISVALLITGIAGGYIAEKWGYRMAFTLLMPAYILTGFCAYFYREDRSPSSGTGNRLWSELKKLLGDKKLIMVGLFIFLYRYSPSFGTPLFFIQRDTFKWGKVWIGTLSTMGTLFSIAGALLYYNLSQRIKIRKWLYFSVFLGAVTTLSYLYYTPLTAIIYDLIYGFLGMFIFLMVMDFMARNTIAGLEATSFAFLCSISNLALVASNLSGAFLLDRIGLNWLIALSAFTSFLCLLVINKIE